MNLKRTAVALLCAVILIVSGAVPKAFADWYDDIESGTYVEIKGQNFVADTFMGVNAYYNESGNSVYHCGELVERFYKEAFGLDVEIRSTEPRLRINTPGYKFVTPDFPKAGDVVFVSAEMRGTYDHWAIVKYYEDGYLVLFEQNVVYNSGAGINRRLKYPSDSYVIFSPVSTGEAKDPVLSGADKPSDAVTSTTEKETETTTKPTTTEKPTTTKPTTTKTTTTAKPTTTKAATTTKPVTTKPVTTKAVTTKPTTTAPVTTTAVSTTAEETTVQYYTYTYTVAESTNLTVVSSLSYDAEQESESENKATLPLAIACGVFAVGVAALVVLLIKKK